MAPGRKGGSRSGSRNTSRRGGRARDKYAADDDDDVESETTASNLPSYSFGGRFLLDPRSEGWVPFEGKGMSSEITAYGFYLIGWVALWACSVGTVATAKEYREAYVKTPKTDISTSQKQMMETADFLWIGQLILGVVIGGAYIVGTLVATYRRVTADTSSWQIHEVDYAPNRRGILQNKRDNLREEAFKSLAKKGSIFYIEFFYVQLMFWTFVGSGSWVAANGWRKKSNKNGRGEWYAMKCTKDTLEFCDQISKMGYVCIAGMVASGFVVAMLWYIWNEWKSARKHFEFAYGDIGEGGDSPAPQVEELDDPQDGTQGVRRGARRPPPRRPPPAARRGGRQPMGRGGGGGGRSGGGGRAALPDYRSRSRSPYDDGDSDDDVPPRGRSQSRSRGRPRRDNRYGDDEYY